MSGAFDKQPRLKVVIGHQSEMMPMMMPRFDTMFDERIFHLKRSVGEMLRSQVWIAISGLFSIPPTMIVKSLFVGHVTKAVAWVAGSQGSSVPNPSPNVL